MNLRHIVWIALASALLLASSGCMPNNSEAEEPPSAVAKESDSTKPKSAAIPVAAVPLGRGRIESVLRYSTHLEAENSVAVYSQASRIVTDLLVEEGDSVAEGELLVRLQDDQQRGAIAKVESQLSRAQRDYDRQRNLYNQQLISEQVYLAATYELEQLGLELDDARRELGYTEVDAPISGVITQRLVNLGDTIQNNDHLFDIVDFDSMVARIYVPEKELTRLETGQRARLVAQATGPDRHQGWIKRILPVVDPRSGTVKVTIAVPRSEKLVPGMYVEVELVADVAEDALLLAKRALIYDQDQIFVFRVTDDKTVERLLVQPGLEDRDFVEVRDELRAGDQIVVAGQAGLKDGAKVRLLDLEEALSAFADSSANPL